MDHAQPFATDGFILIYNGERTADQLPYLSDGYEGHDWGMITGTLVLAAAKGNVTQAGWQNPNDHSQGYGLRVRIDHQNEYETLYGHLSNLIINQGDQVAEGDSIAYSGSTGHSTGAHLHLSVYHNGNLTDPFGWRSTQRDPLVSYTGRESTCLWRNLDEDPISCADVIVEDAGQGSTIGGTWQTSKSGNGYHTYYRTHTANYDDWARWATTRTVAGIYKIYAFIPEENHSTQQATYRIWTGTNWSTPTISQRNLTNTWVLLGTFNLPAGDGAVRLYANTGEAVGTTTIAANAIKFRSYLDYQPVILNNHCTPNYGESVANGNFDTGDATAWTTSRSNGTDPIIQLYGASYAAHLGQYNSNQDLLYQTVCLPSSLTTATLFYNWWVSTEERSIINEYDWLELRLRDATVTSWVPCKGSPI
jgi:hypothetical protein